MSGSRLLKLKPVFLTALILMAAGNTLPGMSAEPLKTEKLPSPSLAMAAYQEENNNKRLVINIPSRTLWVYSGDQIVRYFPVGVGRAGYMTPLGKFSIIRKVVDPGWENPYLPSGKVRLAPGEDNPLGTRWMGFYQKDGGEYGLHGTDNPASVGRFSSHGCVRMKVSDAEALFEMVDVGTPVEVVYQPVLIRRQGNNVRVIVFSDHFKRGMPSLEKVKADIVQQYPEAQVNIEKLKAALQTPTERPVEVGVIAVEAPQAEQRPSDRGKEPVRAEEVTTQQKMVPLQPESSPVHVESAPAVNPSSSLQNQRPVTESELPSNPQVFFN